MGNQAYANRRAVQNEYVPIILEMIYSDLKRDRVDETIELLDTLSITNEMLKEHLLELCMNQKIKEMFDKGLTT